jgi:hypothetical protein
MPSSRDRPNEGTGAMHVGYFSGRRDARCDRDNQKQVYDESRRLRSQVRPMTPPSLPGMGSVAYGRRDLVDGR